MVSGLVLPDITGAIFTRLRADVDVAALCSQNQPAGAQTRVGTSFPESSDAAKRWVMPDYAVLIRRAGGPAPRMDTGTHFARFDVICYGAGRTIGTRRRTADLLWRTVDPVLCPPRGTSLPTSFHAARTIIAYIYAESEPIPSIEPGTDWPRVICPYVVAYMSGRIAA